ncbi:MAG: DHH family phosphoesterase, partial [Erysipelotrichales bacterium]
MKYNIKDTSLEKALANGCNIPFFAAKVLASYDMDVIKDILDYHQQGVVFNTMEQAIELIDKHINNNAKIVIMGDYDCDGVLATSILVKAFKDKGVDVGYYIPNRIVDGYGLNQNIVQQFIDKDYDLIITVDNGINALDAVQLALDNGIDVLVSDHHAIEEDMQDNRAIYVHPAYSNLDYYISGGVVAYYIAIALLNRDDSYLHALAAITLISDVMPLEKGNRIFLRKALANMQANDYLPIKSLATGFIDSGMIGTIIAPKINSLGRLPDLYNPNKLVRYFCSDNANEIKSFAKEIEACNNHRKDMTAQYFASYSEVVPSNNFVMIEEENLHEGLIGLLASRFANQYNCVCLVATQNGDTFKGSVRSIDGINAYEVFKKHSALFDKFGGHAQAMG